MKHQWKFTIELGFEFPITHEEAHHRLYVAMKEGKRFYNPEANPITGFILHKIPEASNEHTIDRGLASNLKS